MATGKVFKVRVVNSPSKFDLMASCFDGKPVSFETEPLPKAAGKLVGAQHIPNVRKVGCNPFKDEEEKWSIRFSYCYGGEQYIFWGVYTAKNRVQKLEGRVMHQHLPDEIAEIPVLSPETYNPDGLGFEEYHTSQDEPTFDVTIIQFGKEVRFFLEPFGYNQEDVVLRITDNGAVVFSSMGQRSGRGFLVDLDAETVDRIRPKARLLKFAVEAK